MPLVLDRSKSVFLHLPKTGGTWVRFALERAGVPWADYPGQHEDLKQSVQLFPKSKRFTVIRNPFSWYASYWTMKNRDGWGGSWVIGHDCPHKSFSGFVREVVMKHPGYFGELVDTYVGPNSFVIKTENLAPGLCLFLESVGESFDRDALMETPITNPGATLPQMRTAVQWESDTVFLLAASERHYLNKYDYSATPIDTVLISGQVPLVKRDDT